MYVDSVCGNPFVNPVICVCVSAHIERTKEEFALLYFISQLIMDNIYIEQY